VFTGEHDHALDEKGRVVIPVMYRDALAGGVFLTRGLDDNLWLFPAATWRTISSRMRQSRTFAKQSRIRDQRFFPGWDTAVDRQGRLAIPPMYRAHAGLAENGPVILVGVNNRIELWNRDRWISHAQAHRDELEAAMEELDL
jgi:MraZ protein